MSRKSHGYRVIIKTVSGDTFQTRMYIDAYITETEFEACKRKIFEEFKKEGFIKFTAYEYINSRTISKDVCINTRYIESISLVYENTLSY